MISLVCYIIKVHQKLLFFHLCHIITNHNVDFAAVVIIEKIGFVSGNVQINAHLVIITYPIAPIYMEKENSVLFHECKNQIGYRSVYLYW